MYKSPGFLGHAAVFGFPLSLGSPPWGAHGGPSLLGLVSVFLVPLLEGSTEGLQSPAQLACSWVHWEGAVMMSYGLQPPAWQLVGGSVCSGTGACSTWRARNRPSQSPGHSLPCCMFPLPRGDSGVPWCPGRVGRRGLEWSSSAVWEA